MNGSKQLVYRDKAIAGKIIYYRVKSKTATGIFTSSNVVKLNPASNAINASITRISNSVKVNLQRTVKAKVIIKVIDPLGRLLAQRTVHLSQPLQEIAVSLPAAMTGKPVIISVYGEAGLVRVKKLL